MSPVITNSDEVKSKVSASACCGSRHHRNAAAITGNSEVPTLKRCSTSPAIRNLSCSFETPTEMNSAAVLDPSLSGQQKEAAPPSEAHQGMRPLSCPQGQVRCSTERPPVQWMQGTSISKVCINGQFTVIGCRTASTLQSRRKVGRRDTTDDETDLSNPPNRATGSGQSHSEGLDESAYAESYSHCQHTPESLDCRDSRRSQPDLHYLNILKDAVDETAPNQQHGNPSIASTSPRQEDTLASHIQLLHRPPQLDAFNREFLTKKGVFDLPPQHYLEVLLRTYFDYINPCGPVIDRVNFLRSYRSGNYSLFLLYALLAPTTLHAPLEVLIGCGFPDRSSAQASFAAKATMLHDFQVESDLLPLLQGSIILGMLILDHPTDKDFHYWFYNSTRLAVKLDIHRA
ncbi:hypothetical protein N7512_005155 [Penicillium capsulatum]|nr:hypothetical protein N7512_005155 [Penicillium capsulatum]